MRIFRKVGSGDNTKRFGSTLKLLLVAANLISIGYAQLCTGSLGDPVVKIDFGNGTSTHGAQLGSDITSYTWSSLDFPPDGSYTVENSTAGSGSVWWSTTDHTGNSGGYMMIVNASYSLTDYFYKKTVSGLCPGTTYEFAAWLMNLLRSSDLHPPDVTFQIEKEDGTVIQSYTTGSIPLASSPAWKQFGFYFTMPADVSSVVIRMRNNSLGGAPANDIALDDITFRPCGALVTTSFTDGSYGKNICEGINTAFTLLSSVSNSSGYETYQWQLSKDNGQTWADISGANLSSYNVSISVAGTYLYRLSIAQGTNISLSSCRIVSNVDTIVVNANPQAAITSNDPTCYGDTLLMSVASASSYNWTGPDGFHSVLQQPFIYNLQPPGNGKYYVTVITAQGCSATDSVVVQTYPMPLADAGADTYICTGKPAAQLEASGGTFFSWSPAGGLNNSSIYNPVASPAQTTDYVVTVSNTGCKKYSRDTVQVLVREDPFLSLTNDTLICSIDTLQLAASGSGMINWTPAYSISSLAIFNPKVSPDVPTTYYATLTNSYGCKKTDSVFVDVRMYVTVNAGNDTVICRPDTIRFHVNSEALQYLWSGQGGYISNTNAKNPFVSTLLPAETFHVIANLGKCQADDYITISTVPYPHKQTMFDTTVCYKKDVQLNTVGGSIYSWSPPTALSATNIPDPVVMSPEMDSTLYIEAVYDTLGCPKPVYDTFIVKVIPPLKVDAGPKDTSVVIGQVLQLNATGSDIFKWEPSDGLSNDTIANPLVSINNDIQYILTTQSIYGCEASDTINIKVYKVLPGFYVPTAFTPNGDGKNDIFKPILLGMKKLSRFSVYNRWGQLVFYTTEEGKGWDGTVKGAAQDSGTFIWYAEGITYKGDSILKQGAVVLIR